MKKFLLQNGKKRFAIIGLLIFFGFGTVFLRLIWLQVIQNEELARRAANQVTGKVTKYSPRGAILDCNGEELAVSTMPLRDETDAAMTSTSTTPSSGWPCTVNTADTAAPSVKVPSVVRSAMSSVRNEIYRPSATRA